VQRGRHHIEKLRSPKAKPNQSVAEASEPARNAE
jgi:hypothetical protein